MRKSALDETDEAAELEKKLKETKTNVENQKKRLKIMTYELEKG